MAVKAEVATKQLEKKLENLPQKVKKRKRPLKDAPIGTSIPTNTGRDTPCWQIFLRPDGLTNILDNGVKVTNDSLHEIRIEVFDRCILAGLGTNLKQGQSFQADNVHLVNGAKDTVGVVWNDHLHRMSIFDPNWPRMGKLYVNDNLQSAGNPTVSIGCDPFADMQEALDEMKKVLNRPSPRMIKIKVKDLAVGGAIEEEIYINPEHVRTVQPIGTSTSCQFSLNGEHFLVVEDMDMDEFVRVLQGRDKPLSNADFIKKKKGK